MGLTFSIFVRPPFYIFYFRVYIPKFGGETLNHSREPKCFKPTLPGITYFCKEAGRKNFRLDWLDIKLGYMYMYDSRGRDAKKSKSIRKRNFYTLWTFLLA